MLQLRVYGDRDYPPFDFIDENGEPAGFNVDITKKIAACMHFDVVFEMLPWDRAILVASQRDTNIIHGIAQSFTRGNLFDFTDEYVTVFSSIFKLRSNTALHHVKDLDGKLVAVQRNDISHEIIQNLNYVNIVEVGSQEEALKLLLKNQVDAITGNRLTVLYNARKMNELDKIMSMGAPLCVAKISAGVAKQRGDLKDLFNEGIRKIKQEGSYKEIYDKWFGEQIKNVDRQLIENVETGIVCISSLGNITAMNKAACRILDIKAEDNLQRSVYESDLVKFVDGLIIQSALDHMENSYQKELTYQVGSCRKDLSINLLPLPDSDHGMRGIIINVKDVTLENLAKKELMTRDKMESLGRLLLNIAHEIRNPLTSVKNFISLMPDYIDDPEFRKTLLKYVPAQIDLMDKLLRDLLEYSSPRAPEKLDIEVVEELEGIIAMIRSGRHVNIRVMAKPGLRIRVDVKHFKQMMINILLNSMDAIDEDGLIEVTAEERGTMVWITVRDNGCGISEESLGCIFDPFYTTKESGTGLGLYITYQLVCENGGEIAVESSPAGTITTMKFQSSSR